MALWKRRIQQTGSNSLGITLPSAWIKHQELEEKDSLKIQEENGTLIIENEAEGQ